MVNSVTFSDFLLKDRNCITFDIAPRHTGIVEWYDNKLQVYYFHLTPPDLSDVSWLYKLRKEFKLCVLQIIKDKHYDYCMIEDVYLGQNAKTFTELVMLNNVVDECIDESLCQIDTLYRKKPEAWRKDVRLIHKEGKKLNPKVEIQELLAYLNNGYYVENSGLSDKEKEDNCFEDICDALGMMLSIGSMHLLQKDKKIEKPVLKVSNIQIVYLKNKDAIFKKKFKRLKGKTSEDITEVQIKKGNIEKQIIKYLQEDSNKIYVAKVLVEDLGLFGVKHKLEYFVNGIGYLYFFCKTAQ